MTALPGSATASETACLRLDLTAPDVQDAVAAAALLADPTRAAVLAMLRDGPYCVCEMSAALDERQNSLSMHLSRLREAGLIRRIHQDADARRIYYERDEAACARAGAAVRGLLEHSGQR